MKVNGHEVPLENYKVVADEEYNRPIKVLKKGFCSCCWGTKKNYDGSSCSHCGGSGKHR